MPKELVPILVATAMWGGQWLGSRVLCLCDNMAIVCAITKGSDRDPKFMRLVRILSFFCAAHNILLSARHVPGVQNGAADALSRNNVQLFFTLNPQASPIPAPVPADLQELAFNRSLLWTSPSWTRLFNTTLETVSRLPRAQPTARDNAAMPISVPELLVSLPPIP